MNGVGTERTRPLPAGFLAAGWVDGNPGENQVAKSLAAIGVRVAFGQGGGPEDCVQQFRIGPYTVDFAWPRLRIALEADGSVHRELDANARRDRLRDRWLREQGWLVFRVDTGKRKTVHGQVSRVCSVVRALARA